uniref:Ribosomal protein L29 n=1 Tax=Hildenbrandia rivularis TaxID=135206 RepID=A0A1C9CFR4_9FLOR|nr:ribosomal protein L29 [Hildenbrandia rivularis]AOM67236.1 ribosomal protein L29 [Hildenbrandia rivularis]
MVYTYIMHNEELTNKILQLKRKLFELRLKKATKQDLQPHLFKYTRNLLTKLLTVKKQ